MIHYDWFTMLHVPCKIKPDNQIKFPVIFLPKFLFFFIININDNGRFRFCDP